MKGANEMETFDVENLMLRAEASVDQSRRIVLTQSQIMCCEVELVAMQTLNAQRESEGKALAYDEVSFRALINEYKLGYNDVVKQME